MGHSHRRDFEVKAKGNIAIRGQVEAATVISKEGDVLVREGIFGKNKCDIIGAGDVNLNMVQDANVEAGGMVTIKK